MHYKHGLFAGSFDPITEGHLDIIQRAIPLCDKLTVGVFINSEKKCMISVEERVAKIKEAVRDFPPSRSSQTMVSLAFMPKSMVVTCSFADIATKPTSPTSKRFASITTIMRKFPPFCSKPHRI